MNDSADKNTYYTSRGHTVQSPPLTLWLTCIIISNFKRFNAFFWLHEHQINMWYTHIFRQNIYIHNT